MQQLEVLTYKNALRMLKIKFFMKKTFLVILFTVFSSQSFAVESAKEQDVKKFVEEVGNKIIKIASKTNLSETKKRSEIISVVDSAIDASWISRFVLGKNYHNINNQQKQEFSKLYRSFMINTYGPKFKNYNGRKFTVNSVEERSGFYIAKAEFLPRESDIPIDVDFRVKDNNDQLVILDFVAEGISLIETQRSEFNSAISQDGIDKFLKDFSSRVEKLKKGS